jgi:hypothetical protein
MNVFFELNFLVMTITPFANPGDLLDGFLCPLLGDTPGGEIHEDRLGHRSPSPMNAIETPISPSSRQIPLDRPALWNQ